jgi:hypothetical protein
MHFDMKSYLKSIHNQTAKHARWSMSEQSAYYSMWTSLKEGAVR